MMYKRYLAFGLGICLGAAAAFGTQTVADGVLTIDGETVSIGAESGLGADVTRVVLKSGGTVSFTNTATVTLTKTYSIVDVGALEVVNAGMSVDATKATLAGNTLGKTFVKKGSGTLYVNGALGPVAVPTRWIAEAGTFWLAGDSFFGSHGTTTTNLTLDLREGAVGGVTGHTPLGPLELTGAQLINNDDRGGNVIGSMAFKGGVTVHASSLPSRIYCPDRVHISHGYYTNIVFNVETGADLFMDCMTTNGRNQAWNDNGTTIKYENVVVKRGGGNLHFLKNSCFTGGIVFEDGTISVSHPHGLGTGAITVQGEVTIHVEAGVTAVCPPVSGSGRITKTGPGGIVWGTVAEGVRIESNEPTLPSSCLVDGTLHLNGDAAPVDVPNGETLTITGFEESSPGLGRYTDIVKTGDGTLVLPTGCAAKYGKLIVKGGFVEVANESCFGADGVTVRDGGGLRFTASMDQSRSRITCVGSAVLDVPRGVTLGIKANYFVTTRATVTKIGGGTWQIKSAFRKDQESWIDFTGSTWITHEGKLKFMGGDNFCGAGGSYPLVLEAHEGAVLELANANHHLPLCAVTLRGATMWGYFGQFSSDGDQPLQSGSNWKGFGLQGPITVLPSLNGEPSFIKARQCHLAHGGGAQRTIFDVRTGATLVVDTMLQPGRGSGGVGGTNLAGLLKRGGGTLKLLKPIGTQGVFEVEAGTVELGPKMRLNANLRLQVAPGAKFVLGDGSQISSSTDAASALCGTADVWLDASRLALPDGAAVSSVPNLGTAGGAFKSVVCFNNYTPADPTFVANGIGGRGCLAFDGSQSIVTTAYTNRGERVQVFIVSKWTRWENTGGFGLWGGPFSMTPKAPQEWTGNADDNQIAGALCYENWSGTIKDLQTCAKESTVAMNPSGIELNTPYLTHSGRDAVAKTFYSEVWTAAQLKAATNSVPALKNCDIDVVCIGGRTRKGVPQIWGKDNANNRQYLGQIGEVLVFSRELTPQETDAIYAYLKKKWFDVGEVSQTSAKNLASTIPVEVPSGEANLAANFGTTTPGTDVGVRKTGAGALRLGATFAGPSFVDVAEGGLVLKDGALPPQVDIWMDASNPDGMALDANGRVTNLVNRGACGGSFVRNTRKSQVPFGPLWSDDGEAEHSINGRPALVFDGDSGLALFSYTNSSSPRSLSIYCIGVRTRWEANPDPSSGGGGLGKWAGPFSFGSLNATQSDEGEAGVVNVQEEPSTSGWVDIGSAAVSGLPVPATGTPYLMVVHSSSNGAFVAYEKFETNSAKVPRNILSDVNHEPFRISIVQIGTRTSAGGGPQWWGQGNNSNRCWFGRMGELIATTEPLSEDQEIELFAYLRRKWLNKGDGSTTPPAWLSGIPAAPTLGAQTVLAMADGTSLRHEAASVTLGALATEGAVDWTRVWSDANDAELQMFDLAEGADFGGPVSLTVNALPKNPALLLQGAAALPDVPVTTVVAPKGKPYVSKRTSDGVDAYWLVPSAGTVVYLR